MAKADLINEVRSLLNKDKRPAWLVFRESFDMPGHFFQLHKNILLTKAECQKLPSRGKIFVVRRRIRINEE